MDTKRSDAMVRTFALAYGCGTSVPASPKLLSPGEARRLEELTEMYSRALEERCKRESNKSTKETGRD